MSVLLVAAAVPSLFFALSMPRERIQTSSPSSLHLVKEKVRGPQEIMVSHSLSPFFATLPHVLHVIANKFTRLEEILVLKVG